MKKLDPMRLNRSLLSERVYETIEESILNGEFAPGDALPEIRLSAELGVSRTPVREAIGKLELEGLVRTIPNRGALVVGISEQDIDDIYTLRMHIEGLAASWAAERITPEQVEQLRGIVDMQEYYMQRGEAQQVWELDNRFHALLYEASGSHVLRQTLSSFHHFVQRARQVSIQSPGRAGPSVQEHRAVMEAVARHDSVAAERLMAEHIGNAHRNIRRLG